MVWFKVDDKFHTSGKVLSIPRTHRLAAVGIWTLAGAWSSQNLTDGHVPKYVLNELGARPRLVQALVEARLWLDRGSDGIEFLSWDEYQRTRHQVEESRAQTAERVANWRNRKAAERSRNTVTPSDVTRYESVSNAVGNAAPDPTRPDPTYIKDTCASADAERERPARTIEDDFADWYEQYPRKRGKGQALKAYKAARKKATGRQLYDAIRSQADSLTAKGADYCPYPATWLNGERWADASDAEVPTSAQHNPYANLKVVGRDD